MKKNRPEPENNSEMMSVDDWTLLKANMDTDTAFLIDGILSECDLRTWDGYNNLLIRVGTLVLKMKLHPAIAKSFIDFATIVFKGMLVSSDKLDPETSQEIKVLQMLNNQEEKFRPRQLTGHVIGSEEV